MNSVERVLYYSNNVEGEATPKTKLDPKPSEWPTKGDIQIQHASMRYRDGPLVLKDAPSQLYVGKRLASSVEWEAARVR